MWSNWQDGALLMLKVWVRIPLYQPFEGVIMDDILCLHCKQPLQTEREKYIKCCYTCRRYALLRGVWPENDPFYSPNAEGRKP